MRSHSCSRCHTIWSEFNRDPDAQIQTFFRIVEICGVIVQITNNEWNDNKQRSRWWWSCLVCLNGIHSLSMFISVYFSLSLRFRWVAVEWKSMDNETIVDYSFNGLQIKLPSLPHSASRTAVLTRKSIFNKHNSCLVSFVLLNRERHTEDLSVEFIT